MVNEETHQQLVNMRLHGMAAAFREYLDQPGDDALTFAERFGLLVQREWDARQARSLKTRLSGAKLREQACLEDLDYRSPRGLDRSVMQRLAACQWVKNRENVLISGATGLGKTWIACALVHKACREDHSGLYLRLPRLLQDIAVARGAGTYPKLMDRLARPDVLVLDDFGLAKLSDAERRDLLEVIEDRHGRRSTVIASQLAIKHWHEIIGEPTVADAILDRLISSAHRIELNGKASLRTRSKAREDGK